MGGVYVCCAVGYGCEQRSKMAELANEGEQCPCEETKQNLNYLHDRLRIYKKIKTIKILSNKRSGLQPLSKIVELIVVSDRLHEKKHVNFHNTGNASYHSKPATSNFGYLGGDGKLANAS